MDWFKFGLNSAPTNPGLNLGLLMDAGMKNKEFINSRIKNPPFSWNFIINLETLLPPKKEFTLKSNNKFRKVPKFQEKTGLGCSASRD